MDREKVVKAIECCVVNNTRCFDDKDKLCPYFSTKTYMCEIELLKDALAMLKEQPEIVRCKDCKYYNSLMGYCKDGRSYPSPDWFCADGVAKDINVLGKEGGEEDDRQKN